MLLSGARVAMAGGKGVVTSGVGGGTGTPRLLITCRSWGRGITRSRMWCYWEQVLVLLGCKSSFVLEEYHVESVVLPRAGNGIDK